MAEHLCPPWIGWLLASPLRRLFQQPETLLAPYLSPGMTALDIGPGMGFFTLPMARMVGPARLVVCTDIQPAMLRGVEQRARAAGLAERIVTRLSTAGSLNIDDYAGRIDFALASAVVHEIPDVPAFFANVARALKPGARLLLLEPRGHVTAADFDAELAAARRHGLPPIDRPAVRGSHAAVLQKA
ncbi:MAG: class I SAM-dependent methyltransferase [Armatimonadota bacterium]